MRISRILLLSLIGLTMLGVAYADTITDSTIGVSYTLTSNFVPISSSGGQTIFQVNLAIDTTNYNGNGKYTSGGYIDALALNNFTNQADVSLVSVNGSSTLASEFAFHSGGLSAGGCDGSGNFFCFQLTNPSTNSTNFLAPNGVYNFTFDVTVNGSTLNTDQHIKAFFTNGQMQNQNNLVNGGLTSMDITVQKSTVPEPTSMMLLGSGLVGLAGVVRKKLRS